MWVTEGGGFGRGLARAGVALRFYFVALLSASLLLLAAPFLLLSGDLGLGQCGRHGVLSSSRRTSSVGALDFEFGSL